MKALIEIGYMIVGIGLMGMVVLVGIIGGIKLLQQINKIKDPEQMEYTNINPIELGLACIVCIGYIVGKLWIHYKVEQNPNKIKNTKGVIKRGAEWEN